MRAVHFSIGELDKPAPCGRIASRPLRSTAEPDLVTCRGACRAAAAAEAAHNETLRLRAVGACLVFLDFDGVLNHLDFCKSREARRAEIPPGRRYVKKTPKGTAASHIREARPMSFDRACVARLNRLLEATGALVVVSSTWRLDSTPRRLQKLLELYGFTGTIIGTTPDRHAAPTGSALRLGKQRGDEIRWWLDALPAPPAAFVVLDDDVDMAAVVERFVRTHFMGGGLTDAKVDEAISLLRAPGLTVAFPQATLGSSCRTDPLP